MVESELQTPDALCLPRSTEALHKWPKMLEYLREGHKGVVTCVAEALAKVHMFRTAVVNGSTGG